MDAWLKGNVSDFRGQEGVLASGNPEVVFDVSGSFLEIDERYEEEKQMNIKRLFRPMTVVTIILGAIGVLTSAAAPPPLPGRERAGVRVLADDPSPPDEPVKLIFIHHSCGENWLNDSDGGLGIALRDNNYFVSDTNYEWGPPDADLGYDNIGDHTDIGHWYNWFVGANSSTYTTALYTEYGQHSWYSRLATDPGGENEIIMFKSCYPNSHLGGTPTDPPTTGSNPLRGQDAWSEHHTVANAKGIYNDLLTYFATRQDKLFVVITAPPLMESETDASHAANARAFNDWLVDDWLDGYAHDNVAVFDFYNVLTSNGGSTRTDDPNTNDAGWADGNHHRWLTDAVQHIQTVDNDYSAYWGGSGGGSHPTAAGNQKATAEFVPLLNVYYNRWNSGAPPAPALTLTAPNGGENWAVGSAQQIRWNTTGTVSQVSLAYSTDGFASSHVIESSIANTGSYDWTVPDDPSTSARVRVASVVSPTTVYDDSDADFTISSTGVNTYTFNAVIAPTNATTPVTYQWSPEPASGQGTASATYQWGEGAHDIMLEVTNCGGTFTATRTINIGASSAAFLGDAAAQQTMAFQDGVSPSAGYAGTTDVILASDADANANLGGLEHLETFFGEGEEVRRSLVRWDLSALPGSITIDGATVELYRHGGEAENDMSIALHRVTREWAEGTGNDFWPDPSYVPDGATWLTATTGVAWTTPGGDYDATVVGQTTLPTALGNGWVRLDATSAVRAWVEDGQPNYGLLLRPLSGDYTYHYYHSREAVTSTLRPRLVVTYTTGGPGPAPSLTLTAPTGSTRWPISSTQQIRWTTVGTVTHVNLAYAIDGITTTIDAAVANTGVYVWTTPPTPTTSARVRVESVVSPTVVYDVSDPFTLYDTGAATSTVHLPLLVRNYAPQPPACPYPLTGVSISGPVTQALSGDLVQPSDLVYQGAFRTISYMFWNRSPTRPGR